MLFMFRSSLSVACLAPTKIDVKDPDGFPRVGSLIHGRAHRLSLIAALGSVSFAQGLADLLEIRSLKLPQAIPATHFPFVNT